MASYIYEAPAVETFDSIMRKYSGSQLSVLRTCVNSALRGEGIYIKANGGVDDFLIVSQKLAEKGLKLLACFVIIPRREANGDESVDQYVFADVMPESVTFDQYRSDIVAHCKDIDPRRAKFEMCDFSRIGIEGRFSA